MTTMTMTMTMTMKLFALSFLVVQITNGGLAASKLEARSFRSRKLAYSSSSSSSSSSVDAYGKNFFAESQNTYYEGYQQAWRYLGHLVKCGYPSNRYYEDEDKSQHSGSGDDNRYRGNNYCQRYLLWAAYVDKNYQGGGLGEYSIYDTANQQWDSTACDTNGNGRCVPMDCHLTNTTTWTLLGVYKEAEYFGNDAFFEQLFKHEGVCVWNDDDQYEFMSGSREYAWPEGCVSTGSCNNDYCLYLDLKPTLNGNMTYGLYVDSVCKTEYTGSQSVDTVAQSMGLLYGSSLNQWNAGLEAFKVCQPCKAYNLQKTSKTYYYSENYDSSYSYDPNNGYFQCDDDAGYSNVNQCMKFRSHADLEVASWEDLVIATEQGGILGVNISGTVYGKTKMSYEQQLYLEAVWAKKRAKEEKEYQALLATVPSSKPQELRGIVSMTLGPLALIAALGWVCKTRLLGNSDLSSFVEPLMRS